MNMLAFISTGWWIFILLAVVLGIVNLILSSQKFERRHYSRIVSALGLRYDPEAKALGSLGCEGLPALARLTDSRNLLHGIVAGVETVCVEVKDPVVLEDPMMGGAFFSLICFRQPGRALPAFQLFEHHGKGKHALDEPRAVRPQLYTIVELRDNPGFQDFFFLLALRQEDEEALRELFPRPVQDFFVERRYSLLDAQGAGEWVGVEPAISLGFSPSSAVKEFQEAVESARRVHDLFARTTG